MIKGKMSMVDRMKQFIQFKEKNKFEHDSADVKYGFELALLYVKFAKLNKKDPILMLKNRVEKWDDVY